MTAVTSKMNRMVLLYMLILSMVSLPTSLAKHLLVETADDQRGDDYILEAAAAAIGVGVEQLNNLLNNLGDNEKCNAAGCCLLNDWKSRDQQSRIQRTYKRCR